MPSGGPSGGQSLEVQCQEAEASKEDALRAVRAEKLMSFLCAAETPHTHTPAVNDQYE